MVYFVDCHLVRSCSVGFDFLGCIYLSLQQPFEGMLDILKAKIGIFHEPCNYFPQFLRFLMQNGVKLCRFIEQKGLLVDIFLPFAPHMLLLHSESQNIDFWQEMRHFRFIQ